MPADTRGVDPVTTAPQLDDLEGLRAAAQGCTGCELWEAATQTVFGAGPASAWLMVVGEQPGDREDLAGEPFVGPAGRLLDRALEQAGITRDETYVTNAVKHFRFEQRGSRRIHKTPAVGHVRACRPARQFRITESRGTVLEWEGVALVPTVHPSAILRLDPAERDAAFDALVADLQVVAAQHG